jgi:hypothetical protein
MVLAQKNSTKYQLTAYNYNKQFLTSSKQCRSLTSEIMYKRDTVYRRDSPYFNIPPWASLRRVISKHLLKPIDNTSFNTFHTYIFLQVQNSYHIHKIKYPQTFPKSLFACLTASLTLSAPWQHPLFQCHSCIFAVTLPSSASPSIQWLLFVAHTALSDFLVCCIGSSAGYTTGFLFLELNSSTSSLILWHLHVF